MKLPRYVIDNYTLALEGIDTKSAIAISKMLKDVEWDDVAAARAAISEAFETVCEVASTAAAELAASFYDTLRENELGKTLGAEPQTARDPESTEGALRAIVQDAVDGHPETIAQKLAERASFEAKRAAGETIKHNVRRDPAKPKYARVPQPTESYADGCPFCRMLAGRGYVFWSKKSAGEDNHYHAQCRCRVVPSFGPGSEVEGYDPDVYLQEYLDKRYHASGGPAENDGFALRLDKAPDANKAERGQSRASSLASRVGSPVIYAKPIGEIETGATSARSRNVSYETKPDNLDSKKDWGEMKPHEKAGFWHLSRDVYGEFFAPPEDGGASANFDLFIGDKPWEMKNVTNPGSSVSNQVKRARVKWFKSNRSDKMRVVITTEGLTGDFEDVIINVKKRLRKGEIAIVYDKDGNQRAVKA